MGQNIKPDVTLHTFILPCFTVWVLEFCCFFIVMVRFFSVLRQDEFPLSPFVMLPLLSSVYSDEPDPQLKLLSDALLAFTSTAHFIRLNQNTLLARTSSYDTSYLQLFSIMFNLQCRTKQRGLKALVTLERLALI